MRFLRRTECIVGKADNHSKIGENAIGHFRVSKSRCVQSCYNILRIARAHSAQQSGYHVGAKDLLLHDTSRAGRKVIDFPPRPVYIHLR